MLVASVTFDLTRIFTLVFTSLLYQKASIEKTTVSTVYNGEKYSPGTTTSCLGLLKSPGDKLRTPVSIRRLRY
jgi:hypothetical protein